LEKRIKRNKLGNGFSYCRNICYGCSGCYRPSNTETTTDSYSISYNLNDDVSFSKNSIKKKWGVIEMEDETEEIINIFKGFSMYFKKAADILEADNLRQHGIQPTEEQPRVYAKDKPQPMDWM